MPSCVFARLYTTFKSAFSFYSTGATADGTNKEVNISSPQWGGAEEGCNLRTFSCFSSGTDWRPPTLLLFLRCCSHRHLIRQPQQLVALLLPLRQVGAVSALQIPYRCRRLRWRQKRQKGAGGCDAECGIEQCGGAPSGSASHNPAP